MKLNKQKFADLVRLALLKSPQSARGVAAKLGFVSSVFNRIQTKEEISLSSFLLISDWSATVLNLSWKEFFDKVLDKKCFHTKVILDPYPVCFYCGIVLTICCKKEICSCV